MSTTAPGAVAPLPNKTVVVTIIGVTQILAWGSSFYLLSVLAPFISRETGWFYDLTMGGVSLGLLVAGVVSPRVGRFISEYGGRPVLASGAALLGTGLLLLGLTPNLAVYFLAWIVMGVGMGAGLYDAAFSTLGAIYGKNARGAITGVTLFGGFASTVCWPLSAYLVELSGWRVACLVYAAIWLGLAVPFYLLALPRPRSLRSPEQETQGKAPSHTLMPEERVIFVVLAMVLTISAAILSLMGTHLLTLLQAQGVALAPAVALGMLIGPSAVGARFVEMFAGNTYHPIWTMIASVTLVVIGLILFFIGPPLFALAIVLYAAGNGIGSIAKGTLPLALLGPERYPVLMGLLGLPIMFAMASSPYVGAIAFQQGGATLVFEIVLGLAILNVLLTGALRVMSKTHASAH